MPTEGEGGGGGGGGIFSHTRMLAATLKPLKLWLRSLATSCFYFLQQSEKILAKSIFQGSATVIFKREVKKIDLGIIKYEFRG